MTAYRIETTISEDGTLMLKGVPFSEGQRVEVTVHSCDRAKEASERYPLLGKPIRYVDPFGSVAENGWDILK